MTVPCTTVPFLSSMVHVSWLSFCKKRTSFILPARLRFPPANPVTAPDLTRRHRVVDRTAPVVRRGADTFERGPSRCFDGAVTPRNVPSQGSRRTGNPGRIRQNSARRAEVFSTWQTSPRKSRRGPNECSLRHNGSAEGRPAIARGGFDGADVSPVDDGTAARAYRGTGRFRRLYEPRRRRGGASRVFATLARVSSPRANLPRARPLRAGRRSKGGPSSSYVETWDGSKYDMGQMGMWDVEGIEGPSCIRLPPLDLATRDDLERVYLQAKNTYFSGQPVVDDQMFDEIERRLRYLGSDVARKYPRCSRRDMRIYQTPSPTKRRWTRSRGRGSPSPPSALF